MIRTQKPRVRIGADGTIRSITMPKPDISQPSRPKIGAQFMNGEVSPVFAGWNPILRDSREDVRAAYWRAAARAVDLVQNSGWIAGVVRRARAQIMGDGLRLASKPDAEALGWTQDHANQWARRVERRFEAWACDALECDAAGKFTLDQQAAQALGSFFAYGEWIALVPWLRRQESITRTKIQLVPAHRLTQDGNGVNLFQGVRVNKTGLPISYRLRLTTPIADVGEVVELRARDGANRPIVRHCYEGEVGNMRGISPFAPVLKVVRQFNQLQDATLVAAMIQTILAATITSVEPTQEVMAAFQSLSEQGVGGEFDSYMEAKGAWYDNTNIDLGGYGRIAHLFPGEKLDFKRSEHPNLSYEPFARFLLRETAIAGGFTVEDLTGDYTGATYSSVRMATTTNWPVQLWRRKHIVAPLYQTAFECWLEEDIDAGSTPFPGGLDGFVAHRAAACRADWRGPAKPQADDAKWAKAAEMMKNMGVVSDEMICAELGMDWEDVYEQRAREADARRRLGLPEPITSGSTVLNADALEEEVGPQVDGKDVSLEAWGRRFAVG